ncbi:winged helix-turn-helix domain-containing protein [Planosporangium thailandense]|uniref:winged helix-turn-helix domain-containing protein n=1 Tax=Planosporangium thailandense TaxID=765197 RepID=UPI0030B8526A
MTIAVEPSTLVVSVQITVARDTPAAEQAFALADRLHALALDGADAPRVSTTVAVVDEPVVDVPVVDVPDSEVFDLAPAILPGPVPQLVLFADRRVALLDGRLLHLTRLEYDLLCYLADNAGRVLTRGQLLRQVWGYAVASGGRTVDVHVRRLRVKLGGRGPVISTVRGIGYRLDRAARVAVIRGPARELS